MKLVSLAPGRTRLGDQFIISAICDAGTSKYFSGIRVTICCKVEEEEGGLEPLVCCCEYMLVAWPSNQREYPTKATPKPLFATQQVVHAQAEGLLRAKIADNLTPPLCTL